MYFDALKNKPLSLHTSIKKIYELGTKFTTYIKNAIQVKLTARQFYGRNKQPQAMINDLSVFNELMPN